MGRAAMSGWWVRLVRFGFHLLYNQFAWTYDFVSWVVSLGEWRRWQRVVLPFIVGETVLEIAHGTGHLLQAMQHQGHRVVGLDRSPFMSRIARRRTLRDQIPLLQASAFNLPFAGTQFDTIVITFPTNFILEPQALQSIYRCLKPNGSLLIVPEGRLLGGTPVHRFIAWLFKITGQQMEAETVWDDWRAQFAGAGFELTVHEIQHPRSLSTVLVATKLL